MYDEAKAKMELDIERSFMECSIMSIEQKNQYLEAIMVYIDKMDVAKVLEILKASLPHKDQLPARKAVYDYMVSEIGADKLRGLE